MTLPTITAFIARQHRTGSRVFVDVSGIPHDLIISIEREIEDTLITNRSELVSDRFPECGQHCYVYGKPTSLSCTRSDVFGFRVKPVAAAVTSSHVSIVHARVQSKQNVLYMRQSCATLTQCFKFSKVLSLTFEDVTFQYEVMAAFAASPFDASAQTGCMLYPLEISELRLDLTGRTSADRITAAIKGGPKKPSSDPLIPMHGVVQGMRLLYKQSTARGLHQFEAEAPV